MNVINVGEDMMDANVDEVVFKAKCKQFGLKEEHYGARVRLNDGTPGKIVTIKERSYKYPIIVEVGQGRRYKVSANQILSQLT
jgi:hypothetical protein